MQAAAVVFEPDFASHVHDAGDADADTAAERGARRGHAPFTHLVHIEAIHDEVEVIPSLQRPKKVGSA